jgi:hypothetical protein
MSVNYPEPRRRRRKMPIALLAATAALLGGAQLLTPGPAGAVQSEQCSEEADLADCEDSSGGGTGSGSGGSADGETQYEREHRAEIEELDEEIEEDSEEEEEKWLADEARAAAEDEWYEEKVEREVREDVAAQEMIRVREEQEKLLAQLLYMRNETREERDARRTQERAEWLERQLDRYPDLRAKAEECDALLAYAAGTPPTLGWNGSVHVPPTERECRQRLLEAVEDRYWESEHFKRNRDGDRERGRPTKLWDGPTSHRARANGKAGHRRGSRRR